MLVFKERIEIKMFQFCYISARNCQTIVSKWIKMQKISYSESTAKIRGKERGRMQTTMCMTNVIDSNVQ